MLCDFVVLLAVTNAVNGLAPQLERDSKLSAPELIAAYGYPSEIHSVQTEDGYILEMHRIPHGMRSGFVGEPVLVMHGIMSSSADFVTTGPSHAPAYILADAGFDVWLGNFRGNTYCKKHVRYATTSREFWNFSWHESGIFDLPAMIDYILDKTNRTSLYYIGHSMGTTTFYVLTSILPEFNSKIKVMFSLAPIAFINHARNPSVRLLAPINRILEWLSKTLHVYEILPNTVMFDKIKRFFCQDHAPTQIICSSILFSSCGWDPQQLNKTQLPVILSHHSAGSSAKQILHFLQEYLSGHFREWDYGKEKNKKIYGTSEPPDYNLKAISTPVILFYSGNDFFSSIIDVKRLNDSLGNPVDMIRVPYEKFNHVDYLWAIDAKKIVYDTVIQLLSIYT